MNRASENRDFSFRSGAASWTWEQALLWSCDAGLAGVVFVAPLFMGGRHPVGKLVYVIFACIAAGAYCLRQCLLPEARWRRSGAEWLILAVVVLLMFQIAPLSPGLLKQLSPGLVKLLPLWQEGSDSPARLGAWKTISVTPRETRAGLVVFLAHALVFMTVVQRVSAREDVERLLRWLAAAAGAMAALALAQYFCGNGRFLWIYMHPARDTSSAAKGSFENQNHLGQFLALGLGPLIWLAWRRFESLQAPAANRQRNEFNWRAQAPSLLIMAALAVVAVAGLLTFSRGGVMALFAAAAVCVLLYAWKKLLGARSIAALGAVGVAASLAILAYGYDPLVREISSLQESQSIEELSEARSKLWGAMLQAAPNHLAFGAGVGSHVHVYPTYLEEFYNKKFTHGENGYLQILLETGIAGCVLLGLGIGLVVFWSARILWRGDQATVACAAPLAAGLAASLVQSLGDFVWYIPGCMSLTVILVACLCRLHQFSGEEGEAAKTRESDLPRVTWIGATALLLSLSAAMVRDRAPPALAAPHWDNYRGLWLRSTGQSVWSSEAEQIERMNPALTARVIEHLEEVVRRDPNNAEANFRLGYFYQKMFDIRQQSADNAMDLTQIRDAALASGFSSRKQQDQWLAAAIGENRGYLDQAAWRLRRSLRLCPLQGEAYVCLAKTAFLDGLGQAAQSDYVKQAGLLRPYEGAVLVAIGKEAIMAGNPERAVEAWKQAFHCNPESQQTVVELLAGRAPAENVVNDLEPDARGLARLFARYRSLNRLEDAKYIAGRYAPMLEDEARRLQGAAAAARPWFAASNAYLYLEDSERALACIEQAVRAAPGEASYRRAYAFRLLEAARYDDAIKQFQWRMRRDPDDESAKAGLARALRRGLDTPPLARKPAAGRPR